MSERVPRSLKFQIDSDIFADERFLSLPVTQQRYAFAQWNRARQNRHLPRVYPREGYWPDDTTHRPALQRGQSERPSNAAIPYSDAFPIHAGQVEEPPRRNLPEDIEALPGFEGLTDTTTHRGPPRAVGEAGPSGVKRPRPVGEAVNSGSVDLSDSDTFEFNSQPDKRPRNQAPANTTESDMDRPNTRSQSQTTPASTEAMETDALARAGAGPGGGGASSSGGFDAAQGPDPYIHTPKYIDTAGQTIFKKVHHMVSWALPYTPIVDDVGVNGNKWIATPLMEVPWKFPYFYMSEDEYKNLISDGSRFLSCKVSIQHLTATTQFETGGSTTATSTTNNAKIFISGFDLENSLRGGKTRKLTIGADMKPTAVANPDRDTFITTQYGVDQANTDWDTDLPGSTFGIPYYSNDYFCVYQPNKAKAAAQGFTAANAPGYENFQSCVTQCNMNDMAWSKVFEYEYKFVDAPVKPQFKAMEIQAAAFTQMCGSSEGYNLQRVSNNVGPAGNVQSSESILATNYDGAAAGSYKKPMELAPLLVEGNRAKAIARQPSLHIGMRAIDKQKVNLTTPRASEFVVAKAQWVVTCELVVQKPKLVNRFTLPKAPTTTLEKSFAGVFRDFVDEDSASQFVTWGNRNVFTPPTRVIRSAEEEEPTPKRRNIRPVN